MLSMVFAEHHIWSAKHAKIQKIDYRVDFVILDFDYSILDFDYSILHFDYSISIIVVRVLLRLFWEKNTNLTRGESNKMGDNLTPDELSKARAALQILSTCLTDSPSTSRVGTSSDHEGNQGMPVILYCQIFKLAFKYRHDMWLINPPL